jgi:chromosome segregation ATPase
LQQECAPGADLQKLRDDHTQAVHTIAEQFKTEARTLAAIKSELDRKAREVPDQLRPALDALTKRTRTQVRHIRQIRQRLRDLHAATLDRMTQLEERFADEQKRAREQTKRDIETLRQEQQQRSSEVSQRVEANRSDIQALMEALERRCRFAEEALESLADEQANSDEELETLRTRREEDVIHLRRQIQQQRERMDQDLQDLVHTWKTSQERIETLETSAADAAQIDSLRRQLAADVQRIDAAIETHRADADTLVNEVSEQLRDLIASMSEEHNGQIEQLRTDLTAAQEYNEQQLVAGVEALRRNQQEQAVDILDCIERNRSELQEMIDDVVDRCRSTQEQIGSVAMAQIGNQEELTRLRHQQQSDIDRLLEQVETQRQHADSEIEHMVARLKQTQDNVEAIVDNAVDPETVQELCNKQSRDTQQIFDTLGAQRDKTETLIAQINSRLDDMVALVEALPEDIATTEHVEQVREQSTAQYNEMMTRLERESDEYQQEMADLNRRWEDLTHSLQELAASALETETFREAEQSFTDGLSQLDGRVTRITGVQQDCLRTVIQKVQQMSDRLHTLEERKPPEPVRIELTPKVGTQLAELIKAARAERSDLESLFDRAHATAEHLDRSAAHMTEVMQNWESRADEVQKQSEQLRSCASVATDLMKAMKRCNETVDAKLKSERWQIELKRAENLQQQLDEATGNATRQLEQLTHNAQARFKRQLEETTVNTMRQLAQLTRHANTTFQQLTAAVSDIDRAQEQAEAWTRRRADGEQFSERLNRLLQRFDQTVTKRQEMLVRVAQSTADLADVIKSSGTQEEQQRPTPAASSREETPAVSDVTWPALRTHASEAS